MRPLLPLIRLPLPASEVVVGEAEAADEDEDECEAVVDVAHLEGSAVAAGSEDPQP